MSKFYGLQEGVINVPTPGTAVPLSAVPLLVTKVFISAQKDRRVANTGDIFIGFTPTAGSQAITLAAANLNETNTFSLAPRDFMIDLSKIYIDAATAGDGVYFVGMDS